MSYEQAASYYFKWQEATVGTIATTWLETTAMKNVTAHPLLGDALAVVDVLALRACDKHCLIVLQQAFRRIVVSLGFRQTLYIEGLTLSLLSCLGAQDKLAYIGVVRVHGYLRLATPRQVCPPQHFNELLFMRLRGPLYS